MFLMLTIIVLLAIALTDCRTRLIPDRHVLAVIVLAAASAGLTGAADPTGLAWPAGLAGVGHPISRVTFAERGIGLFVVSVPMLLISLAVRGAYGGGDIKLMAAAGLLLGWLRCIAAFLTGSLLAGIYAAALLICRRNKRGGYIAFGPWLCMGILIALVWPA